jgi:hypothetical protein
MVLGEHGAPDLPCSENKISLPAMLKIASACSTLQRIQLNDNCDIPPAESEMGLQYHIATANGLAELPSSVRSIDFCWSWPSNFDIPKTRSLSPSLKPFYV